MKVDHVQGVYNVKERPPRQFTFPEIGMPVNLFQGIDISKPIMTTFAPIVTSMLTGVLRQEKIHGKPARIHDIPVRMGDGTTTVLDVYFPKKVREKRLKCPTILIRTPYWKDQLGNLLGSLYTQNGFVTVIHDIRGTGHSNKTGINSFMLFEKEDALDILEWIKTKFWFNGKLGLWGASYLGMTQWCIYDNDEVTCFNTQVSSPQNLWKQHNGLGINEISVNLFWIQCDGAWFYDTPLEAKKRAMPYWQYGKHFLEAPAKGMYNSKIGEEEFSMETLVERGKDGAVELFKERYGVDLKSSVPDPPAYQRFVRDLVFSPRIMRLGPYMQSNLNMDFSRISKPFLIIAGWYDMFVKNNIEDFTSIMTRAQPLARKYTKMVVGPWGHGEVRHPDIKNPLQGGPLDMIDKLTYMNWFRYWLKDAPEGTGSEFERGPARARIKREFIDMPPLLIFTLGANTWRWEREWPLKRTVYQNLYLHSSGAANSRSGDGTLDFNAPATYEVSDTYDFDPADPVLSCGGNNLIIPKGAFEQAPVETRNDVLVYTSAPLEADVEVTGNLKMIFHASSSAIDTDFMVKLCDVYPSGKSFNISDLGIRARYHDGILAKPELLVPGKVYKLEFELFPTSTLFKKGHRIRIDITSSDFPKYDVNSNMGGKGDQGDYTIAKQKIFHDKDNPSCIVLPTIPTRDTSTR